MADYGNAPTAEKCGSVVRGVSVPATSGVVPLTGPSYKRRGIILTCGPVGVECTVGNDPTLTAAKGIDLSPLGFPLVLCLYVHGDVVQKPWFAICPNGTANIGIIEVMEL